MPDAENVAVGRSTFAAESVTPAGPLTVVHETVITLPSGSLAVPASTTEFGSVMVWSLPALTTGGRFDEITPLPNWYAPILDKRVSPSASRSNGDARGIHFVEVSLTR